MSEKLMSQPETINDEKLEAFESQQEIMGKIYEMGFSEYAKALPDLSGAFDLETHKPAENLHQCVCCMDERTPRGIHSAGSGILLSDKDFEKYFEESNADSISSHDGCGAAKIYAKKMGLNVEDSDRIGREWAEKKAKEKGVPHIHLPVERPFHFARVCYYDGTGKFNYEGTEGLPAGFVVGRKYMSKEASIGEAGVAKNIIFGDHGFGELLTEENPFIFVAVADGKKEMEELKKELAEFVKPFGGEVSIEGFIAPKV